MLAAAWSSAVLTTDTWKSEETHERFHRGLVSTPDARRLRGGCGPRGGAQCFHRRLGDAGCLFDPLLLAFDHQSTSFLPYRLLMDGRAFSVNVLKKGQLELAAHYGQPASPDKLALTERQRTAFGYPCCLSPWPGSSARWWASTGRGSNDRDDLEDLRETIDTAGSRTSRSLFLSWTRPHTFGRSTDS